MWRKVPSLVTTHHSAVFTDILRAFPLRAWRSVNTEIFLFVFFCGRLDKREMIKKEIYCCSRQNPYKISKAIKRHSRTLYWRSFLVFLVNCALKWRFAVVQSCNGCLKTYWKMVHRLDTHSLVHLRESESWVWELGFEGSRMGTRNEVNFATFLKSAQDTSTFHKICNKQIKIFNNFPQPLPYSRHSKSIVFIELCIRR